MVARDGVGLFEVIVLEKRQTSTSYEIICFYAYNYICIRMLPRLCICIALVFVLKREILVKFTVSSPYCICLYFIY